MGAVCAHYFLVNHLNDISNEDHLYKDFFLRSMNKDLRNVKNIIFHLAINLLYYI